MNETMFETSGGKGKQRKERFQVTEKPGLTTGPEALRQLQSR
jgi:hypothetical protein